MIAQARPGPYTFADFLELVPEDQKVDLIDGVIHMASPESLEHNELLLWLSTVLGLFIQERQLGRLTMTKVAYRLSDKNATAPDLGFVRSERSAILKAGYVDGPPDLAIEIVSPDSVGRDYEYKRSRYEEAGVREYWIIDPDETRATFLIRDPSGFIEAALDDDTFRSRILPGFSLDTRWLWQKPLPSKLSIVRSMLAVHERL